MAPRDSLELDPREKEEEEGRSTGERGKIERTLSEFNTITVSRGQNRLVEDGGG